MDNLIIPERFEKHKLKTKSGITIIDFVFVLLFAIISALVAFSFSSLFNGISKIFICSLIGIFFFAFLISLLIPCKKYGNLKVWQIILSFFMFKSTNHKFKFNGKGNKNSLNLVPYNKIETNMIASEKEFIGAIKIKGYNLTQLSICEQERIINNIKQFYKNNNCRFSLVKIYDNMEYFSNFNYLNNLKFKNENLNNSENKIRQIDGYIKNHNNNLSTDCQENNFYVFFYSKTKEELNNTLNLFKYCLNKSLLEAKIINEFEIINVIKKLVDPFSEKYNIDDIKKAVKEGSVNIKELLAFNDVEIKSSHFLVKSESEEKYVFSVSAINEYPKFPSRCWMWDLINLPCNLVIKVSNFHKKEFQKKIAGVLSSIRSNHIGLKDKNVIDKEELLYSEQSYTAMISDVASGEEDINKITSYLIFYEKDFKSLELIKKQTKNQLIEMGFDMNNLLLLTLEGYNSILPVSTNALENKFSRVITTRTLSEGFPWLLNGLNDECGLYLGTNTFNEPIIFDQFVIDNKRINHNCMIIGKSGSGKSTLAKKLINFHAINNRKIFIIDPEREYYNLTNYFNGNWINMASGMDNRINPLQIIKNINSIDVDDWKDLITSHLQIIDVWFKILFPSVEDVYVRYFLSQLAKLYEAWHYKDFKNMQNNDWPIITDLINFLKNKQFKNTEDNFIQNRHYYILDLLTNEFENYGKYSYLYNGYTTINLKNNLITCFDILELVERKNIEVLTAQMFLITLFIQNQIITDPNYINVESIIFIDEAHLLINKSMSVGIDFISEMAKRIRKRNGGICLATQNPKDFLGEESVRHKTSAIINNMQYSFLMGLKPDDLEYIKIMYSHFGDGLTQSELDHMIYAERGDSLFFVTDHLRYSINIKVLDSEKEGMNLFEKKYANFEEVDNGE